jgi:hypothetical protein
VPLLISVVSVSLAVDDAHQGAASRSMFVERWYQIEDVDSFLAVASVGRTVVLVVEVTNLWGAVSICNIPPTIIILQVNLAHCFITAQDITGQWITLVIYLVTCLDKSKTKSHYDPSGTCDHFSFSLRFSYCYVTMDMKSTTCFLDTDTCRLSFTWEVLTPVTGLGGL